MKKLALAAVVAVCASGFATTAAAVPVKWTLSGMMFEDGGTASGTFVYDADTGVVSNVNITTTTTGGFTGRTYNYSCGSVCLTSPVNGSFFFLTQDPGTTAQGLEVLPIFLTVPLTNTSTTGLIDYAAEASCIDAVCTNADTNFPARNMESSGSLTGTPAAPPTPTAVPTLSQWGLALMAMALGGLAWLRRKV